MFIAIPLCGCIHFVKMNAMKSFRIYEVAILTVRNLPDEVHRALRIRAARHGRSTEAEVREILESTVKPEKRVRMGDALATLGHQVGLTNKDFAIFEKTCNNTPAEPLRFE